MAMGEIGEDGLKVDERMEGKVAEDVMAVVCVDSND